MEEERYNTNRKTDTAQVLYSMKTDKTKGGRQLRNREEGEIRFREKARYDKGKKKDTIHGGRNIRYREKDKYRAQGQETDTTQRLRKDTVAGGREMCVRPCDLMLLLLFVGLNL